MTEFSAAFLEENDLFFEAAQTDNQRLWILATRIAYYYGKVTSDDMRIAASIDNTYTIGSAIRGMLSQGVLEDSGERVRTKRQSSHGREIQVLQLAEAWRYRWPADYPNPLGSEPRGPETFS